MDPLPHPHRAVLDAELRRVREVILTMGDHVDQAITLAINGLVRRDVALCSQVIADDARLNDLQPEARELSFTVILTQSPVARALRELMGFMHMPAELERRGAPSAR